MKLTVHPDGRVDIETDSGKEAVAVARELRDRPRKEPTAAKTAVKAPVSARTLTAVQDQAWTWLVAHDMAGGLTCDQMARDQNISLSAAVARMQQLITIGVAHKVSRGRYRAGEPQKALPAGK